MNKVDTAKRQNKIARLKMSGAKGWLRRHLIFSVITSLVLVIFIGLVAFVAVYYRDKAAPGTTIANLQVGGQNHDQLVKTIDGLISNMRLSLTYGGKSATASSTDLGVSIDVNKIADEAVKTGQRNPLAIIMSRRHFDLTGSYDKNKVDQFVTTNFPELTTEPKDAQVNYDRSQNRYVVQPGAVGKSVQLASLYTQIEKLLTAPQLANYEIATNDDAPTISDQAAQAAADAANKTLTQNIQIVNNGRVIWTIDPWTIADWTSFAFKQPTKTLGQNTSDQPQLAAAEPAASYDISYDRNKIKQFVEGSVVSQLSNKPVNQKAITDGSGKVLQVVSEGRNGQVASNVDTVVKQIYDNVSNSRGGRIELQTKDAAYGTDATAAQDGHWIEANLSTFQVILHDGDNVVWSTDQTSQGKPGNGTITGLYTVWRKVQEQCMPNPPSTQPLCGIHWVTYWERSGYAFHEAWWLDYNKGNVRSYISHGCINMFTADAKRVYDFASIGTPVWVHR